MPIIQVDRLTIQWVCKDVLHLMIQCFLQSADSIWIKIFSVEVTTAKGAPPAHKNFVTCVDISINLAGSSVQLIQNCQS
jgi:hypothetical protein